MQPCTQLCQVGNPWQGNTALLHTPVPESAETRASATRACKLLCCNGQAAKHCNCGQDTLQHIVAGWPHLGRGLLHYTWYQGPQHAPHTSKGGSRTARQPATQLQCHHDTDTHNTQAAPAQSKQTRREVQYQMCCTSKAAVPRQLPPPARIHATTHIFKYTTTSECRAQAVDAHVCVPGNTHQMQTHITAAAFPLANCCPHKLSERRPNMRF